MAVPNITSDTATFLGSIGATGYSRNDSIGGFNGGGVVNAYDLSRYFSFKATEKAAYQLTLSTTDTSFKDELIGRISNDAAKVTLNPGKSITTGSVVFTPQTISELFIQSATASTPLDDRTRGNYSFTIKPIDYFPDNVVTYDLKSSYSQDQSISLKQLYVHDKEGWQDVQSLTMQVINSAGNVIKETSSTSFTQGAERTEWAQTNLNQSLKDIAPGNYTVRFKGSDKSGSSDPFDNKITITAAAPIKYRDFNGDGKPDIIVQNVNQGWSGIWEMNGTTPTNKFTLLPTTSGAKISGMGDFNGDGKPDIILQNLNQGWSGIWEMNGTTPTNKFTLLPTTSGVISGVGDFNGDGKPDIILQGVDQSWSGILEMNGTTPTKWTALPTTSGVVCGVGDFNGDGKDDIVLQGVDQSWSGILEMNGTTPTKWTALPTTSGMKILGVGDFNGDGKSDIMLQNSNQSVSGIWTMNGAIPTAWTQLPITNGASIIQIGQSSQ